MKKTARVENSINEKSINILPYTEFVAPCFGTYI